MSLFELRKNSANTVKDKGMYKLNSSNLTAHHLKQLEKVEFNEFQMILTLSRPKKVSIYTSLYSQEHISTTLDKLVITKLM